MHFKSIQLNVFLQVNSAKIQAQAWCVCETINYLRTLEYYNLSTFI